MHVITLQNTQNWGCSEETLVTFESMIQTFPPYHPASKYNEDYALKVHGLLTRYWSKSQAKNIVICSAKIITRPDP